MPYALSLAFGSALWVATALLSGRREPWDWSGYWTVSYPIAIAMAGVLGFAFPDRPWRWALAVMFTQAIVMIAGGSGLGLLPLGLVLLAVLALPAIGLAQLAARLRRRDDGH
jgi:hypothetical protein